MNPLRSSPATSTIRERQALRSVAETSCRHQPEITPARTSSRGAHSRRGPAVANSVSLKRHDVPSGPARRPAGEISGHAYQTDRVFLGQETWRGRTLPVAALVTDCVAIWAAAELGLAGLPDELSVSLALLLSTVVKGGVSVSYPPVSKGR